MDDDDDFTARLRRAAPQPPASVDALARQLVREVGDQARGAVPLRRRRGRRTIAAGALAGVVALSGAGTLAAHQLSVPPFQTLEEGIERAKTPVTVEYVNSLGQTVKCLAFIEYSNLSSEQRATIESVLQDEQWEGYGQRTLDSLGIPTASPNEQNQRLFNVVTNDLWQAAHRALPELELRSFDDVPTVTGASMSCAEPGGVDGQA